MTTAFWQTTALSDMTDEQWESLCDGCGLCCLVKLEDESTGDVYQTSASCSLLDIETCRCKDYPQRFEKVPECVRVTMQQPEQFEWMPATCAYRLLYEGKALFDWHPLVAGHSDDLHRSGISVKGFAICEDFVHPEQLEDFLTVKLK